MQPRYYFAGVAPGTYSLGDIVRSGWMQKSPPLELDSTGFQEIKVIARKSSIANYVVRPVTVGRIVGHIFNDLNGDGRLDGIEKPDGLGGYIAQITIIRINPVDDSTAQAVYSDSSFLFDDLAPGEYEISVALPERDAPFDISTPTAHLNHFQVPPGHASVFYIGFKHT